jgi:hypothetical protein
MSFEETDTEDNTIDPIDCYRHFITDEIIGFMVRETNRSAKQYLQTYEITDGQNFVNGNQPLMKRCSSYLESLSR